jgi:pimeloyl-ACP methyl ester carboxylesterase
METVSFPRRGAAGVATLSALAVTVALTACSAGTAEPATAPGASVGADGGAGSPAVVPPGTAGSALRWSACGQQLAGMECASLQVPLNYADPGGRKITIALSMVPATAPKSQQQGVMLVNPGGPGAPGRWLAGATATSLSPQVAADYDIVGFDPRGVGGSVPALSCDPGYFSGSQPDYIPANAAAEQVLINKAKTYAADCEQRFGWLLPYETSVNMARDMDLIRQAFGVQKITYYGFSWGTYLGQVYGTLFPSRVRRMVLDSTVDPTGVWYQDNIAQDYAFQARLDAFYAWTAKYDSVYNLGSTAAEVRSAFYRARDQLKANPVTGPGGQPIGPDEYDDTFIIGAYLNTTWPSLAEALSQYLTGGTAAGLVTVWENYAGQQENEPEQAVYDAVQCADVNWPRNWAKWQADTTRVYQTAPFMAWDNAWLNAPCAFWPVKGPAQPLQIKGQGLPPILMLQGTLDAATPYPGARDAHKLLPSARMVVVEGSGNHGQSQEVPSDTCVQDYLDNYLATGAVPNAPGLVNATCPAVPDPTPGS